MALPPPLPPEDRTVGQLVAETIRLYGRRFWASLPLGLPLAVTGQTRRLVLGHVAVELEVPQLGVREQLAATEQRRADPGAQRGEQHDAVVAPARPADQEPVTLREKLFGQKYTLDGHPATAQRAKHLNDANR